MQRVLICGLGLIGGSLARALRSIEVIVYAIDIDGSALSLAEINGWINHGICLPRDDAEFEIEAVRKIAACCDIIVLAAPLTECPKLLRMFAGYLPEHVLITDIGSVKQSFLIHAQSILGPSIRQYIAAHPIAGSERAGLLASRQDLFQQKTVVLCEHTCFSEHAYLVIADMWRAIGAHVKTMEIALHDKIFSAVSHMPHLLAFSSLRIGYLHNIECLDEFFCAQMKRHIRIAGASASIWSGILLENKINVLDDLQYFKRSVEYVQRLLHSKNGRVSLFSTICKVYEKFHHLQQYFIIPNEDDCRRIKNHIFPKVLFCPTLVVFCYLQSLGRYIDFNDFQSFLGKGFQDFICLAENFSVFCNQDLKIDVDLICTELNSFLANVAIFEDILVRHDILELSKNITRAADVCQLKKN